MLMIMLASAGVCNADRHGDLEATEDLLAVKKNVDQRDAEQRTPLHYAIAYNHPDVMQELLDAGADLTATVCLSYCCLLCQPKISCSGFFSYAARCIVLKIQVQQHALVRCIPPLACFFVCLQQQVENVPAPNPCQQWKPVVIMHGRTPILLCCRTPRVIPPCTMPPAMAGPRPFRSCSTPAAVGR